jgi:putative radical SAM enzyme (TIGR03279 family)
LGIFAWRSTSAVDWLVVSLPRVVAVAPSSAAARAGLQVGDEVASLNDEIPRDLIEWRVLVDQAELALEVTRGGLQVSLEVTKAHGEPLGVEVDSALFDQVRTCDNHCEFCFIYQLPPGLRRSLYLKDDDYRLSFLYGNFTTLTRFTEADLERIVTEGLSPLYVSIHSTDPDVRSEMLRNRRGATSLRWLRLLLDHGVKVHGQVVVCPGVNDGEVLGDTLLGVLDRYPELASVCVVPLGVSRYNTEQRMRPHTVEEARAVVDTVAEWQQVYRSALGRRLVYAADEYYLLADRPFPLGEDYEGFPMHEDGVGMARAFEGELFGEHLLDTAEDASEDRGGFFAWSDGGCASAGTTVAASGVAASSVTDYEPYRAPRTLAAAETSLKVRPSRHAPVALLTAPYGARVLQPLLDKVDRRDARLVVVDNQYFGGNIAVTGLMVGEDLTRVLADQPTGHRYLLPDVCLTQGRFLDGTTPDDLPRPVEVVPADGAGLRRALGLSS